MKYFSIKELTKSSTAERYGIDNRPNSEQNNNLLRLVDMVLDPLREKYGKPIIVNSGFRSELLNKKVNGAKNSQHTKGQAADIQTIGDKDNKLLFYLAKEMDYDQIIWEFGDDETPDWIHISYVSPDENRHNILKAIKKNGRTIYKIIT